MPHCPACASPTTYEATRCDACGTTFAKPRFKPLESRLPPHQEANIAISTATSKLLGITNLVGSLLGVLVLIATALRSNLNLGSIYTLIVVLTLLLLIGYSGIAAWKRQPGWVHVNTIAWAIQIPMISSSIISYTLASGGGICASIRLDMVAASLRYFAGTQFSLTFLTPTQPTIGINLLAASITAYLLYRKREATKFIG